MSVTVHLSQAKRDGTNFAKLKEEGNDGDGEGDAAEGDQSLIIVLQQSLYSIITSPSDHHSCKAFA